jgi:hypothetical protein
VRASERERESERKKAKERARERARVRGPSPGHHRGNWNCRTCSLARRRLPCCPNEVVRLYACNVSAHGQLGGARVHIALLVQLPTHSKHPGRLPLRKIFRREVPHVLASSCEGIAWVLCLAAAPASFAHRDVLRKPSPRDTATRVKPKHACTSASSQAPAPALSSARGRPRCACLCA